MLLRHGHAGPLSVLLSIFDRGGDHTSAWSKGWPVPPPLLSPLPSSRGSTAAVQYRRMTLDGKRER